MLYSAKVITTSLAILEAKIGSVCWTLIWINCVSRMGWMDTIFFKELDAARFDVQGGRHAIHDGLGSQHLGVGFCQTLAGEQGGVFGRVGGGSLVDQHSGRSLINRGYLAADQESGTTSQQYSQDY